MGYVVSGTWAMLMNHTWAMWWATHRLCW